jgi:hypothetical protein
MTSRSKAGTYYSPVPLDFVVLDLLPEKGIIGGVHWAGVPVRHVVRDVNAGTPQGTDPIAEAAISSRLRSMKVAGFVEDFAATGGRIWARTSAGSAHLARRSEVLGV